MATIRGSKLSEAHKLAISNALKGRMPKNLTLINANKKGAGNPYVEAVTCYLIGEN